MADKKHGLGRGIGSLFGGSFDFDSQIENVIEKTTSKPAEVKEKAEYKKVAEIVQKAAEDNPDRISAIYVPIKDISANPNQPRKAFDDESLKELAASIKEQGIIQPIVVEEIVHGKYSIVAGERRFRAAKIAGLDKVPAHNFRESCPKKQI